MDEAAPQAAQGKTAGEQALGVLRRKWGQWYRIGRDDVRGWWAQRRDDTGGDITAGDPGKLQAAVSEDFARKPVTAGQPGWVTLS